jgi:hypothetical protein
MREDTGTNGREAFENGLHACVQAINKLLPELSRRYDMVVIISALAEHMGSALRILQRRKVCDARQARLVIKHIEGTAFLQNDAQHEASGTPPGGASPSDAAPDGSTSSSTAADDPTSNPGPVGRTSGSPAPVGRPPGSPAPENPARH